MRSLSTCSRGSRAHGWRRLLSRVSQIGRLNRDLGQHNLIQITAYEDTDTHFAQRRVCSARDFGPICPKGKVAAGGVDAQFVLRIAARHGRRRSPWDNIDPPIFFATPDADLAAVPDLEDVVAAVLLCAIVGSRPLVAHDDAVATPRRPADLAEGRGNDHIAGLPISLCRDRDKLARLAGKQMIPIGCKPCGRRGSLGQASCEPVLGVTLSSARGTSGPMGSTANVTEATVSSDCAGIGRRVAMATSSDVADTAAPEAGWDSRLPPA